MIEEPPRLSVARNIRRPTEAQIAAFQGVQTSFVADAMEGTGALDTDIGPIGDGRDIRCVAAGPALTADCGPGDVLAIFMSMHVIRPGDILVAACAGHRGCATAGDRVMGMLRNNGAAGYVTDGPVRDYDGIVAAGLPVWCNGLTPASPVSTGPGTVGMPVAIGGRTVASGDMIVADRDGVVVVPFARIDAVIARLEEIKALEKRLDAEVVAGRKVFEPVAKLFEAGAIRYVD